jgi:hypothetical protein
MRQTAMIAAFAAGALASAAQAQLRVASWNISNYGGGRVTALRPSWA